MQRARSERPRAEGARAEGTWAIAEPVAREAVVREAAPRRRFAWLTPVFAVAAVMFATLAGWLWMRDQRDLQQIRALESQLQIAQSQSMEIAHAAADENQMLGAPGTIHVALTRQPGAPAGRAGVLYNARLGVVLAVGQIAPAPVDKSYQLWLVPAQGAPVSLGVFSAAEQKMQVTAHVPPGLEAKAFAVTVEPQGGRPQPTGPKVLVGAAG